MILRSMIPLTRAVSRCWAIRLMYDEDLLPLAGTADVFVVRLSAAYAFAARCCCCGPSVTVAASLRSAADGDCRCSSGRSRHPGVGIRDVFARFAPPSAFISTTTATFACSEPNNNPVRTIAPRDPASTNPERPLFETIASRAALLTSFSSLGRRVRFVFGRYRARAREIADRIYKLLAFRRQSPIVFDIGPLRTYMRVNPLRRRKRYNQPPPPLF